MRAALLESPWDFSGWRDAARRLRGAGVPPADVVWAVAGEAQLLPADPLPAPSAASQDFRTPRSFVSLAELAILNRAPDRFALLYRILWRLKDEPELMRVATDPDILRAEGYAQAVRRAIHKMHAFVRFRGYPGEDGAEALAAWFEPPHYVLEKGADYFVRRLANIEFHILSPEASLHWDRRTLRLGPGADRSQAPAEDATEDAWSAYFAAVFNPARTNPRVMAQHMAKMYWRNLPEARAIPALIRDAPERTKTMVEAAPTDPPLRARRLKARSSAGPAPEPGAEAPASLADLAAALDGCRRCGLWRDATQAVPGRGPAAAQMMVVGEQPGDQEDLRGLPFVGPAGAVLDAALAEAGIARDAVYLTNAVKHFKHEPRGKRRIHKTPDASEVSACRWWLELEREFVRPRVILALGGTAGGAVLGRPVAIIKERGRVLPMGDAEVVLTFHPSYLLRLPDEAAKAAARRLFVEDLTLAAARLLPA